MFDRVYDKKRKALVDFLLEQSMRSGMTMIVVLTLIAFVVWPYFSAELVISWVVLGYFINLSRRYFFNVIKAKATPEKKYYWLEWSLSALLLLSGFFWGMTSWLFLSPDHTVAFVFVALAVVAIAPSALPAFSALPYIWFLYSAPLLLITSAKLYSVDYWQLAVLAIINLLGLTPLSKNLGKTIEKSITLDIENAELLEKVSAEKEKAEKANLAKSQFLAAASHDLRQPLHAQGILLEALKLRLENKETLDLLSKTMQSNDALNVLFNALLEVSQLDAGTIKTSISHQPLKQICELLSGEYSLVAKNRGLSFDVTGDESIIISDPILLNRILHNLVNNALKFTHQGGVKVQVEEEGEQVHIVIKDTGIGIPQSQLENIFNEYYQIGNPARDRTKGIGLGLALVRRMCQLLEHDIKVESVVGQGTSFQITLPRGDKDQVITAVQEIIPQSVENIKILLIDDELSIVDAMTIMLKDWSCQPRGFTTLKASLIAIKDENYRPDLIISDYRLSDGVTGLDAIQSCHQLLGEQVPALIITGDTDRALLESIHQHDFYVLHKPLKAIQIKKVIRRLLK